MPNICAVRILSEMRAEQRHENPANWPHEPLLMTEERHAELVAESKVIAGHCMWPIDVEEPIDHDDRTSICRWCSSLYPKESV